MESPEHQINDIIKNLTEGSPTHQRDALETYFLPDAGFIHPFCRVPRFSQTFVPLVGEINSRWVIWMIYRWYKILSPKIVLDIKSNDFDQNTQILFVEIEQVFSLFFVPFYKSDVHLTTKLQLEQNPEDQKYYIASQEDLYQVNEFVKFVWPGGATILWLWQILTTGVCIIGALLLAPITWTEQRNVEKRKRV